MKPKICIDIQIDTEMKSFSCAARTALIVKNGVLKKLSCFLRTSSLNFKHQFSLSNDVATTKHFLHRSQSNDNFYGHDKQPTSVKAGLGKCDFCRSFHFKSKTEKTRHLSLFHICQKKSHVELTHKCAVYGKAYASLTSLNRHKIKENHTK